MSLDPVFPTVTNADDAASETLASVSGTSANETLIGTPDADTMYGGGGSDTLEGGGGFDVALLSGSSAEYRFAQSGGYLQVWRIEGNQWFTTNLRNIELIRFDDSEFSVTAGGTQRVNDRFQGEQGHATIAALADGGFVAVWMSSQGDGSAAGVYAQRYDAGGQPVGAEFQVNSQTNLAQTEPSVTALEAGGFVVAWQSMGQDGSGDGIYAQRFDAAGAFAGGEIQVNSYVNSDQRASAVAGLADGGFVVVWQSQGEDGSGNAVCSQRFDASGTALGSEVRVNSVVAGEQLNPAVAALGDGGFVVVWQSMAQDGSDFGIYAQRYSADGSASGSEFLVNTATTGAQDKPDIAALAGGGFVVVWESFGQDGIAGGIYAQRFDATGARAGAEFRVNATTIEDQYSPTVAATPGGGFVVAWASTQNGVPDTFAQRFDSDGNAIGGEYRASIAQGGGLKKPSLAVLDGGDQVLVGSGGDVFLQRFDSAGNALLTVLVGGAGADRFDLTGSPLDIAAAGGAGDDTYVVNSPGDLPIERPGEGMDTVESSVSWTLAPDIEHLVLRSSSRIDGTGNSVDNTITGNTYDNVLSGLGGNDTLDGGAGLDAADYRMAVAGVNVDLGLLVPQAIGGGMGSDLLLNIERVLGGGFGDVLTGSGGHDTLVGAGGADTLRGGAAVDRLDGGSGTDVALYAGNSGEYRFGWSGGYLTVQDLNPANGDDGIDYVRNVEVLRFADRDVTPGTGSAQRVDDPQYSGNSYSANQQQAVALPDGGYLIVWAGYGYQDPSESGIFSRRFDAAGNATGETFLVNTHTDECQCMPAVATLAGGGWVVTWQSENQDGSGNGVYAQRFAGDGSAIGTEFRVNVGVMSDQKAPGIAGLADGGFLLTWEGNVPGSNYTAIYARRFDADSQPVGSEFRVSSTASTIQHAASTAALDDGGFVVVWQSYEQDGSFAGIYARKYSAGGVASGELPVNSYTTGDQLDPTVTGLAGGGFVVAWESVDPGGEGWDIYARLYSADASPAGEVFRVNASTPEYQRHASLTALDDGGFLASWGSDLGGIVSQRYDASGAPVGPQFQVSATLWASSLRPVVIELANGEFLLSWSDSSGVFAQRVGADGTVQQVLFSGTSGNDRIDIGGDGHMAAAAGAGDDTYTVGADDVVIEHANEGSDTVESLVSWTLGANFERLLLLDSNKAITATGNDANNAIVGNAFDNILAGLGGSDTLDGGAGSDTADYRSANGALTVDLRKTMLQSIGGGAGGDLLRNIERVLGGGYADRLTGNARDNGLDGGAGDDTLQGERGNDTLEGGGGSDIAVYPGKRTDYRFGWSNGHLTVQDLNPADGDDGIDSLRGIEAVRFLDGDLLPGTGGEQRVNEIVTNQSTVAQTVALADGGWVVVWQGIVAGGSGWDIMGQRYDADGNPAGGEFLVGAIENWNDTIPAVAALGDGGFIVTWSSAAQSAYQDVYARRFGGDEQAPGEVFRVNTTTAYTQTDSSVVALGDGGFLVTWAQSGPVGAGIRAQRFDAGGDASGSEFQVNTYTGGNERDPAAVALADGGYLVAWTSWHDGSYSGVFAQRFGADGTAAGLEFQVNTFTTYYQENPVVAALADGGFVVVWRSSGSASSSITELRAQRYDANGAAADGELLVASVPSWSQFDPAVAGLAGGGFVVTWDVYSNGSDDVAAQRYDANGVRQGEATVVNATTAGSQRDSSVTALPDGGFLVTWTSSGSGQVSILMQRFDADGNPVLATIAGTAGADRIDLGGSGRVAAEGGAGDDTYVVSDPGDRVIEAPGGGNDTVEASSSWTMSANVETLVLTGSAGSSITGNASDNLISGNDGWDTLAGGGGNDRLVGGSGIDSARYAGAATDYLVTLRNDGLLQVTDKNLADGNEGTDLLEGIERLLFVGHSGSDVRGEFAVHTTTAGSQANPALALLADDSVVVVWQSPDGNGTGIYLQRFELERDGDGNPRLGERLGTETLVNTTSANAQTNPVVAALAGGGCVVAWESLAQDGSGRGIYAQRYDASGAAEGGEFRVNLTTALDQGAPSIAALADGGFVVGWESDAQDGSGLGIFARRFDANGVAQAGELQVNQATAGAQRHADIDALPDGGFVVVWESLSEAGSGDGSGYGIFVRRFDAGGEASGAELLVNKTTMGSQTRASVAVLADGGFVVAWESADGSATGVFAQRFDALGAKLGTQFRVNTTSALTQSDPEVTAAGDGFVISWTSTGQDGDQSSVHAQRYRSDGSAVLGEISVATTTAGGQSAAEILGIGAGGMLVAWQSNGQDGHGLGVYAKGFEWGGGPLLPAVIGTGDADIIDLRSGSAAGYGLHGDDIYRVDDSGDVTIEMANAGEDTIRSSASWTLAPNIENLALEGIGGRKGGGNDLANHITGSQTGSNELAGFEGNDTLAGGAGNDTLDGGAGTDSLIGGGGADVYIVDGGDSIVELPGLLVGGSDTVRASSDWTLGANLEHLQLTGTEATDGSGNAVGNRLTGNSGANLLQGLGGNDTLDGGTGADTLKGGSGNEWYIVDSSGDVVIEGVGAGQDSVQTSVSFWLGANVENLLAAGNLSSDLVLGGNALANTIRGGNGNDRLDGRVGVDTLYGGLGNDTYYVDGADVVVELPAAGTDTVRADVSHALAPQVENLELLGSAHLAGTGNVLANELRGNTGNNVLIGADGNDTLSGGAGNDTLGGQAGADLLRGGAGEDRFVFDTALDAPGNVDRVLDFQPGADRLVLGASVFTAFAPGEAVTAARLASGAGLTAAQDADDRLVYDTSTGALYYDPDGTGGAVAVQFAVLGDTTHPSIGAQDFVVSA